jgi:hypothetical protein
MNDVPENELLSAYLDGELTADEKARVEQLLATDPRARQLLDELRALSGMFQALPRHALGQDISQQVLHQAQRRMLLGPADMPQPASKPKHPHLRNMFGARALFWSGLAVGIAAIIMISEARQRVKPNDGQIAQATKQTDQSKIEAAPSIQATEATKDDKSMQLAEDHVQRQMDQSPDSKPTREREKAVEETPERGILAQTAPNTDAQRAQREESAIASEKAVANLTLKSRITSGATDEGAPSAKYTDLGDKGPGPSKTAQMAAPAAAPQVTGPGGAAIPGSDALAGAPAGRDTAGGFGGGMGGGGFGGAAGAGSGGRAAGMGGGGFGGGGRAAGTSGGAMGGGGLGASGGAGGGGRGGGMGGAGGGRGGRGGAPGGGGGGMAAPAAPSIADIAKGASSSESAKSSVRIQSIADADNSVLLVYCDVTPEAARQQAFAKLLADNKVVRQDTVKDQTDPNEKKLESMGGLDLIYVEAATQQVEATLSQLAAQPDRFISIAVHPAPNVPTQQGWSRYNRPGVISFDYAKTPASGAPAAQLKTESSQIPQTAAPSPPAAKMAATSTSGAQSSSAPSAVPPAALDKSAAAARGPSNLPPSTVLQRVLFVLRVVPAAAPAPDTGIIIEKTDRPAADAVPAAKSE